MFKFPILPLTLLALLATPALTGCMDEDMLDDDLLLELSDEELLELTDEELLELELELELDDPAPEPWDDTGADEESAPDHVDEISPAQPGPCEPNPPPLDVQAPELADDEDARLPPPKPAVQAPDFLDESDDDDGDDDDGEGLTRSPYEV